MSIRMITPREDSALQGKLKWAMLAYAVLALLAALTLDGNFRFFVLILLGALALKSWIAVKRESVE
ncbi:MAG: hypothetical protein HXY18_04050 [Bryobacteraceae bacterium]|nr:hypothetical protein [Bryobacteraceae bacterium]